MLGERVRHARTYLGWSQAELAERAGSKQPKISQLEAGTYVSADLVDAVAKATGFSRWWFDLGPLPDLPRGTLKFRKAAASSVKDDDHVRLHVRQAVEVVERSAAIAKGPDVRVSPVRGDVVVDDLFIEQLALDARELLGVGPDDPIPNLVRAIERAGIVVIGSAVEVHRHDGASYWPDFPAGRPMICFSRGRPGDRQRFSIAHELGHLLLHQHRQVTAELAEKEAHRFAGALLIPAQSAIDEISPPVTLRTLALVKARWGISIRALIRRSLDLHIIDSDRRVSLEKQLSVRGWNKQEPVEVAAEVPALLRKLIEPAGRAQDFTGLPPLANRDLIA